MAGPTRIVSDRANEAKKTTKKKPEATKSKKAEAEAAAAAAAAEAAAAKDKGSSGYGSYGQSKKVKKKVRSDCMRMACPACKCSARRACALPTGREGRRRGDDLAVCAVAVDGGHVDPPGSSRADALMSTDCH